MEGERSYAPKSDIKLEPAPHLLGRSILGLSSFSWRLSITLSCRHKEFVVLNGIRLRSETVRQRGLHKSLLFSFAVLGSKVCAKMKRLHDTAKLTSSNICMIHLLILGIIR